MKRDIEKRTVNTIDWMLSHKGIAIAKIINNNKNTVEIINYTENIKDYSKFRDFAKSNDYIIIIGKEPKEENRLGYFRDEFCEKCDNISNDLDNDFIDDFNKI